MAYEYTPLVIPFVLSIGCLFVPFFFARTLSDDRFRVALALWILPIVVWSVAAAMRLAATTVAEELLWHNLRFFSVAVAVVGYFLFTAVYTDRPWWLHGRRLGGLFVVPATTQVAIWTSPKHPLVRATVEPAVAGPYAMTYVPGPVLAVHSVYSYLLVAVGTAWLVRRFWEFRERTLFRGQILVVLLSVGLVVGASLAADAGVTTVDWTPVAGAVAAVAFGVAASEYRFFDVSPLAREVVVENMDSGMLVVDPDGEVIDANATAATILDTSVDDLVGTSIGAAFGPAADTIDDVLASGDADETVETRVDGMDRYYDISVSPITDPTDADVGTVVTFADVTDRVERQRRLREQNDALERQNERLDQFASVVSHDLRNPLTVTAGHLDLLREDAPDEHVEPMARNLDRMESIIDDLLTMARAGRTVAETEPVALAVVASDAWAHTDTDGCDLDLCVEEDVTVQADRQRLLHVFENLFRNAADHNEGATTVRVGTLGADDATTDGGSPTGFFVADDGAGIPESRRPTVFDHGYTTDDDGTGFGLSIVRDVVEGHGWDITVTESAEGGARFEINGLGDSD